MNGVGVVAAFSLAKAKKKKERKQESTLHIDHGERFPEHWS